MPALNFRESFAAKVTDGRKRQTIRKERKRPIKAGDILYLNAGMRTRRCRRLKIATCTKTELFYFLESRPFVDNRRLSADEQHALAVADGFKDYDSFYKFFKELYGTDFEGVIIHW